jgi:hypothetical protein
MGINQVSNGPVSGANDGVESWMQAAAVGTRSVNDQIRIVP